jgi:4-alpha-glucanotransferase
VAVPSNDFFNTMIERFREFPIIAEDLGVITPDVKEMMNRYGFPGMKVLLFAFGDDDPSQAYLPHNYERNSVVYTGTHDNNTVRGWFENGSSPDVHARLSKYVGREVTVDSVHWELIRLAMQSVSDMAIFPMQDLLGLGEDARMNLPGTLEDHWGWRLQPDQLTPELASALADLTHMYARG